jgi:hypothetical protein
MEKNDEIKEIKNEMTIEGDKVRESLLDNLFNINALLSTGFLVFYQFDNNQMNIKLLNVLPFVTVVLIMIYKLGKLRLMGYVYHNIEKWDDAKKNTLFKFYAFNNQLILIPIVLTLIEIGYVINIFIK